MADQYQIDLERANAALKEMIQTTKFLTTSVKDLTSQISGMAKTTGEEAPKASDQMGKFADGLEKRGIPTVKQFRQEQRLQNFVIREGTQMLTSMVFALGFLAQGQKDANSVTKQVTTSLLTGVAAMEASEFAFFSMSQAGKSMGGALGSSLMKFSAIGGVLSIIVGLGAAVVSFFAKTGEAAQKAADTGLTSFIERFKTLSGKGREDVISGLETKIKELRAEQDKLVTTETYVGKGGAELSKTIISDPQAYNNLAKQISARADLLEAAKKEKEQQDLTNQAIKLADDALKGNYTTIQDITRAIAVRKAEIQDGVALDTKQALTQEQIRERKDQIVKLEAQLLPLQQSSLDAAKQRAEVAAIQYKLQTISTDEYIKTLRVVQALQPLEKDRLATEEQINGILDAETAAWKKLHESQATSLDDMISSRDNLEEISKKTEIANIQNVTARAMAEEDDRHQKALDNITTEYQKGAGTAQDLALKKRADAAENFRHEQQHQAIINDAQLQFLSQLDQGFGALNQGLSALGVKADSTMSRLLGIAQLAIQIASTLSKINAGQMTSEAGGLNIAGLGLDILGMIFGFAGGGYTGPGSRNQVAGVVHRGEMVFEKPIVDRNRPQLEMIRAIMQSRYAGGGYVGSSSRGHSTSHLEAKIDSLGKAIQGIQIVIKNPITLREGLQIETNIQRSKTLS